MLKKDHLLKVSHFSSHRVHEITNLRLERVEDNMASSVCRAESTRAMVNVVECSSRLLPLSKCFCRRKRKQQLHSSADQNIRCESIGARWKPDYTWCHFTFTIRWRIIEQKANIQIWIKMLIYFNKSEFNICIKTFIWSKHCIFFFSSEHLV